MLSLPKKFLRRPKVSYQDVVEFIVLQLKELDNKIIELIETTKSNTKAIFQKQWTKSKKVRSVWREKIPANIILG